jgi:hypothetical protein
MEGMAMRIYLDACCLNRPFDDFAIDRNHLEAEAVLAILGHIGAGEWQLIGSEVLDREIAANPDIDKRQATRDLLQIADKTVVIGIAEADRAAELLRMGLPEVDVFHVACAESAECDVFLTTDDVLQKRYNRLRRRISVRVENPLKWLTEQLP